jgi:hypothetical protein
MWRVSAFYSFSSNARGPNTKDQTEVEIKSILEHYLKCQRTRDQGLKWRVSAGNSIISKKMALYMTL